MKIEAYSGGSRSVSQVVPVTAGAGYAVSGWLTVSGLEGSGARLRVQWRNATGGAISTSYAGVLKGTAGWTQVGRTLTAPTGAVAAQLSARVEAEADNLGSVVFDDLVMEPAAAGSSKAEPEEALEAGILEEDDEESSGEACGATGAELLLLLGLLRRRRK
jgi:hypothetical protein